MNFFREHSLSIHYTLGAMRVKIKKRIRPVLCQRSAFSGMSGGDEWGEADDLDDSLQGRKAQERGHRARPGDSEMASWRGSPGWKF